MSGEKKKGEGYLMELHLTSLRAFPLSQVSTLSQLENCLSWILSFIVPPAAPSRKHNQS